MPSSSRRQLEDWLKEIDVPSGSFVLDVGGAQKPVKGRTKSWEGTHYSILDLEVPHEDNAGAVDRITGDIESQEYSIPQGVEGAFDVAFCLEVSEYWINPLQALKKSSFGPLRFCNVNVHVVPILREKILFVVVRKHDDLLFDLGNLLRKKMKHTPILNVDCIGPFNGLTNWFKIHSVLVEIPGVSENSLPFELRIVLHDRRSESINGPTFHVTDLKYFFHFRGFILKLITPRLSNNSPTKSQALNP